MGHPGQQTPGLPALLLTFARRFVLAGSSAILAAGRLAAQPSDNFAGARAGAEREIAGTRFFWCPPGSFLTAGNEFEWCRDWYHARLSGGTEPDLSAMQGTPNRDGSYSRARRGGAWMDGPQ